MAKNIVQHVSSIPVPTSKYVADSSVFYSDRKAPLLVLVEDEEDKPFWSRLFLCVGSRYRSVDIHTLRTASATALAQTNGDGITMDATGKDSLMKVTGLGTNKVVAVDADYDLLIDYHSYSQN